MKNFSFLLLNILSYISFYNADGRYLLIDVDSEAKIETGPTVMRTGAKHGKMLYTFEVSYIG